MAEALLRYSHGEAKFTAATTYASGQIIQLSDGRAGVIAGLNAIASGDAATAYTAGVFAVATASATTFSKGDPVYWDADGDVAITTPGADGDMYLGPAMAACANGDTTVLVDLNASGMEDGGIVRSGTYTAVSGDATADTLTIETGLTSITTYFVQIYRSGVPIYSDQAVSVSGGGLTVADGAATYEITADDVICWTVIGS